MCLWDTPSNINSTKTTKILPHAKYFSVVGNRKTNTTSCPCGCNIQALAKAQYKILLHVIYLCLHHLFIHSFVQEILSKCLLRFFFLHVPITGMCKVLLESSGIIIWFGMEMWVIINGSLLRDSVAWSQFHKNNV